ncbi:MAG: TLD-domain-containing protein [Linnemannia elongata]|nr:MAG: TLD-domain-containing protein [Linnemannia elongata]
MPVYSNPDALGADFLRLVNSPVGADVRLIIADELCLDDLLFGCERFALTILCRDNVLEMVELASRHRLGHLKTECLDFIAANIEHLKRGRGICQVEDGILKDILAMDQLDLDELEVWKIAVRWAYFQLGLDWETCPLVEFPKGTGCIVVQPVPDPEEDCITDSPYQDQQKQLFTAKGSSGNGSPGSMSSSSLSDDEMTDARVPLGGTTVHLSTSRQKDLDEDGFRQSSHSVFQRNDAYHKIVNLPISVHEDLARRILPLLSSIRFLRIPSMDFLRLIEGTGLLPMYLCAKVYRHHSVPSMSDPYQPSLRRRMAFSTILSKDHKEILLEWLQAAIQGAQSGSGTAGYGWHRSRSTTTNSSTTTTIAATSPRSGTAPISLSSSPSSSSFNSLASGAITGTSPPAYWSRSINNDAASTASHRLSSPAATSSSTTNTSNLGHRSTRSGSGYSTLTHSGSFTAHPTNFSQSPTSPSLVQSQLPLPKLTLQYRASRDGFAAHNFHMSCDQRGPTLTVVRADNGTIFGGYNSSSWSSHPSGVYSTSRANFLFTLKGPGQVTRENTVFGVKGDGNAAAYNKADCGPTFGVGHDLYLASNCDITCQSSSTMPSSYNGPGASTAALAGSLYFRVQEYEVFLVQSSATSSS